MEIKLCSSLEKVFNYNINEIPEALTATNYMK